MTEWPTETASAIVWFVTTGVLRNYVSLEVSRDGALVKLRQFLYKSEYVNGGEFYPS